MIPVVVIGVFGWYTVASYGYVLLKGYDIPFTRWVSPLNPYRWPAKGDPQTIPPTQVFPSSAKTQAAAAATAAPTVMAA